MKKIILWIENIIFIGGWSFFYLNILVHSYFSIIPGVHCQSGKGDFKIHSFVVYQLLTLVLFTYFLFKIWPKFWKGDWKVKLLYIGFSVLLAIADLGGFLISQQIGIALGDSCRAFWASKPY